MERLSRQGIRTEYQPVVELATGSVVAYEAFARGPAGTALDAPHRLFAAARAAGRAEELERACWRSALEGVLQGGLAWPESLLLDVSPAALASPDGELEALADRVRGRFHVMLEVSERALAERPGEVLRGIDRARELGFGIALDHVGPQGGVSAVLPFARPDVIKLDLGPLSHAGPAERATLVSAVAGQAERTGAAVVAQGVDLAEDAQAARALGASLGQGWLCGRPGPIRRRAGAAGCPLGLLPPPPATARTPFEVVRDACPPRRAARSLVRALSRQLEEKALALAGGSVVVLSTLPSAPRLSPDVWQRYQALGARASFVGAVGTDIGSSPIPGVHGASLDPEDRAGGEWDVLVVGPDFAGGLVARELDDRRLELAVTHDRELVVDAARCLWARMAGQERVPAGAL